MSKNNKVVIRPVDDLSVKAYMPYAVSGQLRAPNTTCFKHFCLDGRTGQLSIDFSYLDYEALNIKVSKEDTPIIEQMKLQLLESRKKRLANVEIDRATIETQIIINKAEYTDSRDLINRLETEIKENKKLLSREESKNKKDESLITKLNETVATLTKQYMDENENFEKLFEAGTQLQQKLVNIENEINTKPTVERMLEENIERLTKLNVKSEKELHDEVAKLLGGENLSPNLDNPIWKKIKPIKLQEGDIILNKAVPTEALKLCMLMGGKTVAKSSRQEDMYGSNKIEFYIFDEENLNNSKINKQERKSLAYSIFSNMTLSTMRDILNINNVNAFNLRDTDVRIMLGDLIESDLDKFLYLANLENTAREKQSFVSELLQVKIINTSKNGQYSLEDENDIIPVFGLESLVEFIYSPQNRTRLEMLKEKLKARKDKISKVNKF